MKSVQVWYKFGTSQGKFQMVSKGTLKYKQLIYSIIYKTIKSKKDQFEPLGSVLQAEGRGFEPLNSHKSLHVVKAFLFQGQLAQLV